MSDKLTYANLLAEFASRWNNTDVRQLLEPFAEDAVFVASPFEAPLAGVAAIEAYWRDVAFEQAELAFRHGEIYPAGPWFATDFRCTFGRLFGFVDNHLQGHAPHSARISAHLGADAGRTVGVAGAAGRTVLNTCRQRPARLLMIPRTPAAPC